MNSFCLKRMSFYRAVAAKLLIREAFAYYNFGLVTQELLRIKNEVF